MTTTIQYPIHAPAAFNGAAADQPRKSPTEDRGMCCRPRPSMGPRLISRGNENGQQLDSNVYGPPSMGPRLISRGNTHPNNRVILASYPSMGPRLISRGNGVM